MHFQCACAAGEAGTKVAHSGGRTKQERDDQLLLDFISLIFIVRCPGRECALQLRAQSVAGRRRAVISMRTEEGVVPIRGVGVGGGGVAWSLCRGKAGRRSTSPTMKLKKDHPLQRDDPGEGLLSRLYYPPPPPSPHSPHPSGMREEREAQPEDVTKYIYCVTALKYVQMYFTQVVYFTFHFLFHKIDIRKYMYLLLHYILTLHVWQCSSIIVLLCNKSELHSLRHILCILYILWLSKNVTFLL